MTNPIIETNNLIKTVSTQNDELTILQACNLSIAKAETVAIVGASGSGKSTLLGLLAGLDQASGGTIHLAGHELTALDEEQRAQVRGQHVGFIFQSFMLVPSLTALENVMLPAQIAGLTNPRQKALQVLADVGLAHRCQHYPNQLSGGEQQRVAIARAFITEPSVLFADEPTGNLDAENSANIEQLLFALNAQYQTTLVLVTHDPGLANKCQRQLTMQGGHLQEGQ